MRKTKGMLIATAAASLILSGAAVAEQHTEKAGGDKVMCSGVNSCKGTGACAGVGHACAGKNACKGQGVVELSKDECAKKGGKVTEAPKH